MMLLSMKVAAETAAKAVTQYAQQQWFPSAAVSRRLFVTGATVGPIVDGIHNQCLLQYKFVPIIVDLPQWYLKASTTTTAVSDHYDNYRYYEPHVFASSWIVPPLLGIAYIVLGGILPRILQNIITTIMVRVTVANHTKIRSTESEYSTGTTGTGIDTAASATATTTKVKAASSWVLGLKAVAAIVSTAMIVSLSQYLILHPNESTYGIIDNTAVFESSDKLEQHLLILITAAITQWAYLDGTFVAFVTASITSILGPLAELPFVSHHIWEYLPNAGDIYVPLQNVDASTISGQFLQRTLGDDYQSLALNGVTGPCYFAVAMDAIAIGRFFDSIDTSSVAAATVSSTGTATTDDITENRLFIASSRDQQQPQPQSTIISESDTNQ